MPMGDSRQQIAVDTNQRACILAHSINTTERDDETAQAADSGGPQGQSPAIGSVERRADAPLSFRCQRLSCLVMETKTAADAILDLARAQNAAYLEAYRQGYEAGMNKAFDQCLKIINRPITEGPKK